MRQYDDHHTAMTTALSTGVYLPDVMALESSFVGKFSNGGGLSATCSRPRVRHRPVPVSRYVAYAYDQAINRKGQVVAAPTDIGPGTHALSQGPARSRRRSPRATCSRPGTPMSTAGVKIKKATGANLIGNVRTLKDLMIRGGLKKGQGIYFDADSNVLVDTPRFHRAFELALRVRRNKLEGRLATWSNEWAEAFRRGATATELGGSWMVGQLANWVAPIDQGPVARAQLPESTWVSYGGTYYAIPRDSDPANKALAWELVQMLTLDPTRQLAALKTQDAFPALLAAQDDPFIDQPQDFLGGERARRCGARPRATSPPRACTARPSSPRTPSTPNSTTCSTTARTSGRRCPTRPDCSSAAAHDHPHARPCACLNAFLRLLAQVGAVRLHQPVPGAVRVFGDLPAVLLAVPRVPVLGADRRPAGDGVRRAVQLRVRAA